MKRTRIHCDEDRNALLRCISEDKPESFREMYMKFCVDSMNGYLEYTCLQQAIQLDSVPFIELVVALCNQTKRWTTVRQTLQSAAYCTAIYRECITQVRVKCMQCIVDSFELTVSPQILNVVLCQAQPEFLPLLVDMYKLCLSSEQLNELTTRRWLPQRLHQVYACVDFVITRYPQLCMSSHEFIPDLLRKHEPQITHLVMTKLITPFFATATGNFQEDEPIRNMVLTLVRVFTNVRDFRSLVHLCSITPYNYLLPTIRAMIIHQWIRGVQFVYLHLRTKNNIDSMYLYKYCLRFISSNSLRPTPSIYFKLHECFIVCTPQLFRISPLDEDYVYTLHALETLEQHNLSFDLIRSSLFYEQYKHLFLKVITFSVLQTPNLARIQEEWIEWRNSVHSSLYLFLPACLCTCVIDLA